MCGRAANVLSEAQLAADHNGDVLAGSRLLCVIPCLDLASTSPLSNSPQSPILRARTNPERRKCHPAGLVQGPVAPIQDEPILS